MNEWFYAIADSSANRYFRISVDDIDCSPLAPKRWMGVPGGYDCNSLNNSIPSVVRTQRRCNRN